MARDAARRSPHAAAAPRAAAPRAAAFRATAAAAGRRPTAASDGDGAPPGAAAALTWPGLPQTLK